MDLERVRTVDYHTGGEPFRIVPEVPVTIGEHHFTIDPHDPMTPGFVLR